MKHFLLSLTLSFMVVGCAQEATVQAPKPFNVDEIAIRVTPQEDREYSYTDKKSGYYYGTTHQNRFDDWHAGWNVAQRRIFSDYQLFVDNRPADRMQAKETLVYPYKLERLFDGLTEEMLLVDDKEILLIRMSEVGGDSIGIRLEEELLSNMRLEADGMVYTPKEASDRVLKVVPYRAQPVAMESRVLKAAAAAEGFLIVLGEEDTVGPLIEDFRNRSQEYLENRYQRMNRLITQNNPMRSNLDSLDRAIAWLLLTTDQLITKQQGNGIYAGLPWFNEYWGRDMFISTPGACLVTGQFEIAKEIFSDFSRLQDTRPNSITQGRIPNRANINGILYNTTDGTPRLVTQIEEYVRYSGDTDYIREVYPVVKLSIDAAIRNYTDNEGYLVHADADTWMDVKRKGIPGSPRGNRANDIQALWYGQLKAGEEMAVFMQDEESAVKWAELADKLQANFEKDYADRANSNISDHLNADGTADRQFRPNQLYAFDLIKDEELKMKVTRKVWEELVYPWGTSSLSQHDDDFHPQHENWHYYHKDDAYHNGTVWLWNNGHAMQRMIEMNQPDIAWTLFTNMNRQALVEGAVGSLSENADAHPREGKNWPDRSGTFLQAWSNAEQLRVWYQYFIGMIPHLDNADHPGLIALTPKLPAGITELYWKERVGKGNIEGTYDKKEGKTVYTYRLNDAKGFFQLRIAEFPELIVPIDAGCLLVATQQNDRLTVHVERAAGETVYSQELEVSAELKTLKEKQDAFFAGTQFAVPVKRENLKAFNTYHEKALTYQD